MVTLIRKVNRGAVRHSLVSHLFSLVLYVSFVFRFLLLPLDILSRQSIGFACQPIKVINCRQYAWIWTITCSCPQGLEPPSGAAHVCL